MLALLLVSCVTTNNNQTYEIAELSDSAAWDADGDGEMAVARGGRDCDDEDPSVGPDAEETWANAYEDANCDGERPVLQEEFGGAAFVGEGEGAHAGRRVGSVGVVAEGEPAIFATAAVYEDGHHSDGGEVYLLQGAEGGALADRPSLVAEGASWYLGSTVNGGADIDGDELPDLVVGATGADDGAGRTFLISGAQLAELSGERAVSSVASLQIVGVEQASYSAASAGPVADMDGDGLAELVVSAPYRDVDGWSNAGQVAVFASATVEALSGGVASFDDADLLYDGYYDDAVFGNTVQSAGDQDGDGLADLMISADQGVSAVIVPGGGDGGSLERGYIARVTREGSSPVPRMVGDLDGDGTPDLALLDETAWLMVELSGRREQHPTDAYTTVSTGDGSRFYDAADLGDRDGDGRAETALSVPSLAAAGTSWLGLLGSDELGLGAALTPSDLRLTALSLRPDSGFGYRMANVGDVTGDGVAHLALGGWSDPEGGVEAGAVTMVEVP